MKELGLFAEYPVYPTHSFLFYVSPGKRHSSPRICIPLAQSF